MKTYKVLWLDDAFENQTQISIDAEENGILLEGYKSSEEGIEVLKKDIYAYDAILLDAKFFKSKGQVSGSEDLKGLKEAVAAINELKSRRVIPYFILSGQAKLKNDETFADTYGKYYRKGNIDDIDELFEAIKKAGDQNDSTQLKHKHQQAFEVCTEDYVGEEAGRLLMDILLHLNSNNGGTSQDEHFFNPLRKILEAFFLACHRKGFLHDKCRNKKGNPNLTWSYEFLSGGEVKLPSGEIISTHRKVFPDEIAAFIGNLKGLTSNGSHYASKESESEEDKESGQAVAKVVDELMSPFLLKSLTYQMMHVLVWFKRHTDLYPYPPENIKNWVIDHPSNSETNSKDFTSVLGKVKTIHDNGFGFFTPSKGGTDYFIPTTLVSKYNLVKDMQIEVNAQERINKNPEVVQIKMPANQGVTSSI